MCFISRQCTGSPGQGQDGLQWPVCHDPSWEDQEANKDHLRQPEPSLGGKVQLVSWACYSLPGYKAKLELSGLHENKTHGDDPLGWVGRRFQMLNPLRCFRLFLYVRALVSTDSPVSIRVPDWFSHESYEPAVPPHCKKCMVPSKVMHSNYHIISYIACCICAIHCIYYCIIALKSLY